MLLAGDRLGDVLVDQNVSAAMLADDLVLNTLTWLGVLVIGILAAGGALIYSLKHR